MNLDLHFEEIKNKGWLLPAAVFFVVFLLLGTGVFAFEKKFENKIYPGVYIGNIDLSGLDYDQAQKAIQSRADQISFGKIKFKYEENSTDIDLLTPFFAGETSNPLIIIDSPLTAQNALRFGRDRNFFVNFKNQIASFLFSKKISAAISIDENKIKEMLAENYANTEVPAENPNLIFSWKDSKDFYVELSSEKIGKVLDYNRALGDLKNNVSQLQDNEIQIYSKTEYPTIAKNECLNVEQQVKKIIAAAPFNLTFEEKKWMISPQILSQWLELKRENGPVKVALSHSKINEYLDDSLSKDINKEPQDAKFEIKDGRVSEFLTGKAGMRIDYERTYDSINNLITSSALSDSEIEISVTKYASAVESDQANNFGIKEIIGTGVSDFSGSSANRKHNIKTGSMAISGILIAPGSEFSTIKTLGEIDAQNGYLPELVIKGNKTIPEYGGGLCQVGTTLFRAAVASGLPITERRNHSYRVTYYEPAGTDATIYDPQPDFKFKNDTGNYILIQHRIEGNKLYFDFWGAKDGRIVEKTEPKIYNITKPATAQIVETTNLKPGEKKCTEKAHNGADAYFDYKVTYPLETGSSTPFIKEQRFTSHYIPWREVCLIGIEKPAEATSSQDQASSPSIETTNKTE